MMARMRVIAAAALVAAGASVARAQLPERGANQLADEIAGLGVTMRVLVIAAHPDDEDTRLITWLTKGHRAEVAYLSLTRGDGGQNLIGNELGDALGAIRTEELLTARRLDGAHQYFTRAYDFGFSKSAEETYKHWPHDSLLKDVITVVRAFRPQVIVSVFTGTPRDGHGQHQVSAILAREAYDFAGDSVRYPAKSTQGLGPWTVSKFYRGRSYFGPPYSLAYDAGEYDPIIGMSYAELAVISRSQHRSQGTGALPRKGPSPGYLMREATRVNAGTDSTKEKSIFEGIDTSWAWVRKNVDTATRADSIPLYLSRLRESFNPWRAAGTASPGLKDVRNAAWHGCRGGPPGLDPICAVVCNAPPHCFAPLDRAIAGAERALLLANGIRVEAVADRALVAIGDSVRVIVSVYNGGQDSIEVHGPQSVAGSGVKGSVPPGGAERNRFVAHDGVHRDTIWVTGTETTQPRWLTSPRRGDLFSTPVSVVAEDELAPSASVDVGLRAAGYWIVDRVRIAYRGSDPVKGEVERPLLFAPPITLTLGADVEYVPAHKSIDRTVHVRVRSASAHERGVTVSLKTPKGLAADTSSRSVTLAPFADATVDFRVRGTLAAGNYALSASAQSNGQTFTTGYQLIDYDHIRPQTLYRDASVTLQAVDVVIPPGANVAYIQGTNDNSAPALQQLGVPLTMLDPATLARADLTPYTAIVIGPRAYETDPGLVANNARLLEWVKNGGTLVVQYGQYEMTQPGIMPYPITLSRPAARVTEEDAAVTVLAPQNALLNSPNKINAGDWKGWVQDFALYMPSTFDKAYTPLVSMHDTGEPANDAGLLVAPYGRGTYVYATLAFFRQLPAGVPGAAKLFVNLLGARQAEAPRTAP